MEHRSCEIFGLRVEYLETSVKGEVPLIILHGWGSRAERWRKVLEALEGKNIHAVAIDLPGFGATDPPGNVWGLKDYEEFAAKFLEIMGIKKFYLLGHSFGGRIAMKLAARHAPGLEKLLLVASAGVTPRSKTRISAYKLATKIAKPIFTLPVLNIFENIARKIIYKFSGSYDYYIQHGLMRETFKMVIAEDLTPHLSAISIPTYIIWGAKDEMTPLFDAYIIQRNIKNSKLTIIENGNHNLNLQMPESLAEKISNCVIA